MTEYKWTSEAIDKISISGDNYRRALTNKAKEIAGSRSPDDQVIIVNECDIDDATEALCRSLGREYQFGIYFTSCSDDASKAFVNTVRVELGIAVLKAIEIPIDQKTSTFVWYVNAPGTQKDTINALRQKLVNALPIECDDTSSFNLGGGGVIDLRPKGKVWSKQSDEDENE